MSKEPQHADDVMPVSGMKVSEAITKARAWWNEYRGAIRHTFNLDQRAPEVHSAVRKTKGMGAPAIVIKKGVEIVLPDGILSGLPWAELTLDEQRKITRVWHQNHVLAELHGDQLTDMAKAGIGSLAGSEPSETKHAGKTPSTSKWSFNRAGEGSET